MKNYVIQWVKPTDETASAYTNQVIGCYATSWGYRPKGNAKNISEAFVFNTRMNRSRIPHQMTPTSLAKNGMKIIWVDVVPIPDETN